MIYLSSDGGVFKIPSKVITLILSVFQPMRRKSIAPYMHNFFNTLKQLQVIATNSEWFIAICLLQLCLVAVIT